MRESCHRTSDPIKLISMMILGTGSMIHNTVTEINRTVEVGFVRTLKASLPSERLCQWHILSPAM
jgi:hypothetical protein